MSNFLTHILNRHRQSENTVRPRGLGIFETPLNWSESKRWPTGNQTEQHILPGSADDKNEKTVLDPYNKNYQKITNPLRTHSPELKYTPQSREYSISDIPSRKKYLERENPTVGREEVKNANDPVNIEKSEKSHASGIRTFVHDRILNNEVDQSYLKLNGSKKAEVVVERRSAKPIRGIENRFFLHYDIKEQDDRKAKNNHSNQASAQEPLQSIKVHIGRIDIKAVKSPTENTTKSRKSSKQGMSLQQFLKRREDKSK